MFLKLLQTEWFKLRKSKFSFILFIGPLIAFFAGFTENVGSEHQWEVTLLLMSLTYSLLFLPLVTGVLAGLICRYEHQEGGWKQLLALPVSRGQVFVAKYTLLLILVFVIQLLFLLALYAIGMIKGYSEPFPMLIVWKSIVGGWVATFPLVALQLWMSMMWKSFAAPFAVNVIFTLPAILAVNSSKFGPYYPWGQPFLMMYVSEGTSSVFFVPWEQVLIVVGGSFLLFFLAGFAYLQRKAV